ncbi:MAG: phage major capsid protein [Candidatus Nanopelagicaceae bacterium]
MSNELLEKAAAAGTTVSTGFGSTTGGAGVHVASEAGNGGLLNPEQSARFLDYVFDATVIGKVARTVRMRADTTEIDRMSVGEKLMKLAAEADNTAANSGVTFSKISLTTKKLRMDWELSTESLEDNIEGADLEDHIARLMATQAGNDIEDVILNGDELDTGDALYKSFDGVVKKSKASGHVVDAAGATVSREVFNKALKALPRKYKQRRGDLRFLAGSNLIQDFLYANSIGTNQTIPQDIASGVIRGATPPLGGPAGYVAPFAFGIPIVEVPLLKETQTGTHSGATGDHGDIHLTFPNNVVIGIKRDVTVYRFFWPRKDSIEYTMYTRVGVQIEQADAWVVVKNVKVAS